MSLTSFVSLPDVRAYLKEHFVRPNIIRSAPTIVPLSVPIPSWIGTGFDYLLRWTLLAKYPLYVERERWVAEAVPDLLRKPHSRLARTIAKRIAVARRRLARFCATGRVSVGICRSAVEMAQIDPLFRAGIGAEYVLKPMPARYVSELRQLIDLVPLTEFAPTNYGLVNPLFVASPLVVGADADLLVDDMLVEIKTSKHGRVPREQFNQLLGYYLLSRLGGIPGAPENLRIKKLAIYQSRQARLVVWEIDKIASPQRFRSATRWFERRARRAFGWGSDEDWHAAERA